MKTEIEKLIKEYEQEESRLISRIEKTTNIGKKNYLMGKMNQLIMVIQDLIKLIKINKNLTK